MTRGFRHASTILLGTALAAGLSLAPARAEELRIGFIAPMTGIFAQVGKDMVNGFQMYLDEHGGKLGGTKVKFIVEDDQAKPDLGVTKAKKLVLQDKVHMFIGGVLASTGYALAPVSTEREDLYIALDSRGRRSHPAPGSKISLLLPHRLVVVAAAPSARPMGLRPGLQEDRHHRRRLRLRLRAGRRLPEGVRGLRRQDRSRRSGRRSAPRISDPISRRIKADADAIFTLMVGPMSLQFPKQLRASGYKKPIVGGGTSYDEFALPFDGRRSHRRRLGAAVQRRAGHAEERGLREGVPRQVRQGAVLLLGGELHHRAADRRGDEEARAASGRAPRSSSRCMRRHKLDAPRGPVRFDDMRNPVQNIYIKKVEKKKMFGYDKDELWNTVIKTYPNVSQFWTYGKDSS